MKTLLPLILLAGSGTALAQTAELWFDAGESLLTNNGIGSANINGNQNDYSLNDGFRFGFRFGINSWKWVGHEIQYAYSRTHLIVMGVDQGGMAIHQGGYNMLAYATPEGWRIRPFGTGGVQFSNFVPPGASATSGGGSTKFGFNYGGGVKAKISSLWAVRFDVRRYETPKPFDLFLQSGWLNQTEISAGVGIVF